MKVRVRGRHWLVFWLVLFLGVAGAVVTRQRAALDTARALKELRDTRTALESRKAELERQIDEAVSRPILIPRMKNAGLHEPTDLENTILRVDSLPSGARPDL